MTAPLTTADIEGLAETWVQLEIRRQEIVEAQETIKTQLRDQIPDGTRDYGNRNISIRPVRRFNADKAKEILDPETVELISTTVIDTGKARHRLAPAIYDACKIETGTKVVSIT